MNTDQPFFSLQYFLCCPPSRSYCMIRNLDRRKKSPSVYVKVSNKGSQYHSSWLTEGEAEKERSCPSWFERAGLSSAGSQLLSCACLWKARLALPGGRITACAWVDEIVPALDDASGRVTGCLYSEWGWPRGTHCQAESSDIPQATSQSWERDFRFQVLFCLYPSVFHSIGI